MALAEARGDYVAQWDDDDYAAPDRLAAQMGRHRRLPRRSLPALAPDGMDAPGGLPGQIGAPPVGRLGAAAAHGRSALSGAAARRRHARRPAGRLPPAHRPASTRRSCTSTCSTATNTFDAAHWQEQMRAATTRYTHYRYRPPWAGCKAYLQVELERLGAYLSSGRPLTSQAADGRFRATARRLDPRPCSSPAPVQQPATAVSAARARFPGPSPAPAQMARRC